MPGTTIPVTNKIYHSCYFLACFIYIDDFSRVKLSELPGEEGSDYINASFVDVSIM